MKTHFDRIIHNLSEKGFVFRNFSLHTEGDYAWEDGIWNYLDAVAHLPHIHDAVDNIPVVGKEDVLSSVFIQKLFGLKLPLVVVDYQITPNSQTAFMSYLFFVLVVHNECEELVPGRTRVTTTYHVGSPKVLSTLFPLVRFVLQRNYRALMETDIPLRERRGELRRWGYRFDPTTYDNAQNILRNFAHPPQDLEPLAPTVISLSRLNSDGDEVLLGKTDHQGVRLRREGEKLYVFPRLCHHQGAVLDEVNPCRGRLSCPWHGRQMAPLTVLDLNKSEQVKQTRIHQFVLLKGELHVRQLKGKKTPLRAPSGSTKVPDNFPQQNSDYQN